MSNQNIIINNKGIFYRGSKVITNEVLRSLLYDLIVYEMMSHFEGDQLTSRVDMLRDILSVMDRLYDGEDLKYIIGEDYMSVLIENIVLTILIVYRTFKQKTRG
jgi:hypothetical protein